MTSDHSPRPAQDQNAMDTKSYALIGAAIVGASALGIVMSISMPNDLTAGSIAALVQQSSAPSEGFAMGLGAIGLVFGLCLASAGIAWGLLYRSQSETQLIRCGALRHGVIAIAIGLIAAVLTLVGPTGGLFIITPLAGLAVTYCALKSMIIMASKEANA